MCDEDLVLLDRWCAGNRDAGNQLFKRHFDAIYRFFANKTDGDVEELVQETFLSCVRGQEHLRRATSFRTYLFAIARHTLYRYWRRRAMRGQALDFDEISIASLSTSARGRIARHEEEARLLAALRELPLDQQLLLELHYWDELESDQLAEVFDVEPATTRSRLFRARQALRQLLDRNRAAPGPAAWADGDLDAWARGLRPESQLVRNAPPGQDSSGP